MSLRWIEVCRLEEIPPDGGRVVSLPEEDLLLVRKGDGVYALRDFCPHQGMPLGAGKLDGEGAWVCPFHGARFRPEDGAPLNMPADGPVESFPVKVEGDKVLKVLVGWED